jgi:hypothetical protein
MKSRNRKEYYKQYAITHPRHRNRKKYHEQYYCDNKEEIDEKQKQYVNDHKTERKKYKKQYDEKTKEQRKKYCVENEKMLRDHLIKKKYGITAEQYDAQLNKQEGKCEICHQPQEDFKKRFCVDHDHTTGEIRGLLCFKCNLVLGHANDDTNILSEAIQYVEKYNTNGN